MVKKFYTDGGCSENGSLSTFGIIVSTNDTGKVLFEKKLKRNEKFFKIKYARITSNICELEAIRYLLITFKNRTEDIIVSSDSQLAQRLITLKWFCKEEYLAVCILRILKLFKEYRGKISFIWESRTVNKAGIYIENKFKF